MIRPWNKLLSLWHKLLGAEDDFSMENRLYNLVCIIIFILLVLLLANSIAIHLWQSAGIVIIVFVFQLIFYYYARFKKKFNKSILANAAVSYIALCLNFFVNAGSNGPTLFIFFLTFQLLVAITPNKMHVVWMLLHIVSVSGLLTIETLYPKLVINDYSSPSNRLFDFLYTYIVSLVFIYLIVRHLRIYLHRQQQQTEMAAMKLKAMFESSDNSHIFLDRHTQILYFNRGAADFFERMYSKAIAAGMNLPELLNPEYVDDFRRNFKLVLQGEKIKEERLLTYHNSEQIWWSISYIPVIDSIDQIIGVSFIAVNITETKLQQESIRRKNESLIKIAHMQAHEIRNPVVNILGLINLIKLEGHTHTNEYLPLLEQAACNLDTAIKGIIEQTDTASGHQKIIMQNVGTACNK